MTGTELHAASSDDSRFSERVITAVADARGEDPLELPPLYDVIDLEALDDLFAHGPTADGAGPDRVVFTFADREVVVSSDGDVTVTEPVDRTGRSLVAGSVTGRGETGPTDN